MPNRFPGVDPYLEGSGLWPDFHHEFITAWRAALRRSLPKHYEARINEEIHLIDVTSGDARKILPDVAVERRDSSGTSIEQGSWRASTSAVILPLPVVEDEVRESWIEIFHRPDRSLVAVLEFLSPTNKRGEHRSNYLAKRRSVLRHQVHLVELDLFVGGERITPPYQYPAGDFFALTARAEHPGFCEVIAWTLHDRLPEVAIPLKAPDADIIVDLQTIFELAYERGDYADSVDYSQPPSVPLAPADLHWAANVARAEPT